MWSTREKHKISMVLTDYHMRNQNYTCKILPSKSSPASPLIIQGTGFHLQWHQASEVIAAGNKKKIHRERDLFTIDIMTTYRLLLLLFQNQRKYFQAHQKLQGIILRLTNIHRQTILTATRNTCPNMTQGISITSKFHQQS